MSPYGPSVLSHFQPQPRKPTVRRSPRYPSPSISPIREELVLSKKVDPLQPPRKSRRLLGKKTPNYTGADDKLSSGSEFEISPTHSGKSDQDELEICVLSPKLEDSQNLKKT